MLALGKDLLSTLHLALSLSLSVDTRARAIFAFVFSFRSSIAGSSLRYASLSLEILPIRKTAFRKSPDYYDEASRKRISPRGIINISLSRY